MERDRKKDIEDIVKNQIETRTINPGSKIEMSELQKKEDTSQRLLIRKSKTAKK